MFEIKEVEKIVEKESKEIVYVDWPLEVIKEVIKEVIVEKPVERIVERIVY